MVVARHTQRVEQGRHDVDRLDHVGDRFAARGLRGGSGVHDDHRRADRLFIEKFFFAKPVITQHVAMVGTQHDQRVLRGAAGIERIEHAADVVIELSDQAHIGRPDMRCDRVVTEVAAFFMLMKGAHHRMRIGSLMQRFHRRCQDRVPEHRVVGRWRHIRPMRFYKRQMQAPSVGARRAQKIDRPIGEIGGLGMRFGHAGRPMNIAHPPSRLRLSGVIGHRDGEICPGVITDVTVLAQKGRIAAEMIGFVMPVEPLEGHETALAQQRTALRLDLDAHAIEAFGVRQYMGLAGQGGRDAGAAQIVSQRQLRGRQRHAVPARAVAHHITPGVIRHARRAADRPLHEGPIEARATGSEPVDVGCGDR